MQTEFLCGQLIQYGYRRVDTYLQNVTVLWGDRDGGPHLLAVISPFQAQTTSAWQLINWRDELERITGLNDILFVVMTFDERSTRMNLLDAPSHWVLDTQGFPIIDAGQPYDFHQLKNKLDVIRTLPGAQEQAQPRASEAMLRPTTGRTVKVRSWKDHLLQVTVLMILINVIVFLVDLALVVKEGGTAFLDDGPLYWWGALFANIPQWENQYYRMFTCMFLHAGLQHLVGNMLTLYFIGSALERTIGHIRFSIIYIVGGLVASVVQYVYYTNATTEPTAMLGASGAIFSVIGAFLYVMIRNYKSINKTAIPRFVLYIALSLYSGFMNPGVSVTAHIGGFIGGILLAALIYRKPQKTSL